MNILDFEARYQYELEMTALWQKAVTQQGSCFQLFDLQERLGFEDRLHGQILGGRIRERYLNVGFHHGKPVICFHADSFRKQYESDDCLLSAFQRSDLQNLMQIWDSLPKHRGITVYSFEYHDISWLPSPDNVLTLGIIGLYDLYRTEEACYARLPEYIRTLNNAIDRYKYLACWEIVEQPESNNARRIYEALGRVKYQAPVTLFQAFQLLLLHCQIFRPDHLEEIDSLLSRFIQESDLRDEGELSFLKSAARDFFSRYVYCVHSLGHEVSVTFEGQKHQEFCNLIRETMESIR